MKSLHILLLLLVVAVWGVNFVFIKISLDELSPMLLCFVRFFLLSIPAIFFFKFPAAPPPMIISYSLVMFVLQFSLMFSGICAGVTPGLASLLLQTQAFFSILFASLILKEKLNRWQISGALLSFSGIALVGLNLGASATLPGLLLILFSAAAWGGGSVMVKKMGKVHPGSLLVWSSFIAWPPLLFLSLLFENSYDTLLNLHHLSSQAYLAILFIILASTVFGFGVWNWLLQLYPVSTVAPFTLLVPVFGMLSSILVLNETLELWKILSALLVISGLCLNLLGPRFLPQKAPTH